MITLRQLERLWNEREFGRLAVICLGNRQDASITLEMTGGAAGAAALAILRLDELNQAHAPLSRRLIEFLLREQDGDGGWGDVATTAVCLRALMCWQGKGVAVDRAMGYLTNLQKADGLWPRIPLRRLASDARVSAFVLMQLWDQMAAQQRLDLTAAARWFENHAGELDDPTARLWRSVRVRSMTKLRGDRELAWCS